MTPGKTGTWGVAGWGEEGAGVAHFGLAQQLLELGLWQEAVVLHKGGDLGRPLALIVHGAVDLHVLAQDAQGLLLPLEEDGDRWEPHSRHGRQSRQGEDPWAGGSEDVGPSTSCVTPVKALSSLILSFLVESVH